jgi:thiosulfate reductase/polysulfide reductase chain A
MAAAAGTKVLAESPFTGAKARAEASRDNARYVPTVCEICFWKCGLVAKVVDGRVVKLEGNPLHPQSRGMLCGRGQGGLGLLYDKDRLKHPMIRTGPRGEDKYRRATWDEALGVVAEKMEAIKEKHGPEAMALFAHGTGSGYMGNLLKAFGSSNISYPSFAQCKGPREVGFNLTFGEGPASSVERVDLANSRVVALFGTHLGENMHNSQVQDFAEAIGRGAKFIVVDPRFSTAASKAAMWLPIKPGTDTALALSWINILITEGLYDKEYIDTYATGFEELKAAVKQYTPAWAARVTDLPESQIIEAARELGRYKPNVVVHPGRHVVWHGNDTQRSRAIAILNALLGSWGREGGLWLAPKAKLPKVKNEVAYPDSDRDPLIFGDYPFAIGGLTNVVRDATISGNPYPIKGWMLIGTNLMKTLPNQKMTREAIDNLDLLVSIDVMPTDTVMLSDVILPAATYLERHDELMSVKQKGVGVALRQPVVDPMYESKPPWLIAKEICNKLGLDEYVPYNTLEDMLKKQAAMWNLDYDELMDKGYVPVPGDYQPYITPTNKPKFKTESGRINLYSHELEDEDFDPVPTYEPIEQPPDGHFRLLYGRSPVHTFARTANNQWLWELKKENSVWLNSQAAEKLGIKDKDRVTLVNQNGTRSEPVAVKVTERIRQDCVYVLHGFGSNSKLMTRAFNRGLDDQRMVEKYNVDPICGATGMRVNFVKLVKEV